MNLTRDDKDTPPPASREIPIAEYRYEEIYPSFKAGTDEKEAGFRPDADPKFVQGVRSAAKAATPVS